MNRAARTVDRSAMAVTHAILQPVLQHVLSSLRPPRQRNRHSCSNSQGLESKTFTRLRDPHGRGNVAASGRSTLPGAFAVHPRSFHEDCKVHSPYAGFSGGTTESTSNVAASRPTSGIRVIRLSGVVSGTAIRGDGTYYATRCGCRFNKIGLNFAEVRSRNGSYRRPHLRLADSSDQPFGRS